MIKANELRIGNYVLNDEGNWFRVNGDFISNTERNNNWGSPIHLTPEILEKFGFKLSKISNNYIFTLPDYGFLVWEHSVLYLEGKQRWLQLNHIKYLHQLQNLYFDLTGEELPINLQS